jgi:hypothetical protein
MDYQYQYEYDAGFPTGLLIFFLCIWVFYIICMWKVFIKAGRPGWESIIPIYNLYIMIKIGGKPGWWLLMFFIPLVNLIFLIWTYNMISKSFGKDEGFTVGLLLLGVIFWPILAFGGAKYLGPFGNQAEFQARQNRFEFENQNQQNPA